MSAAGDREQLYPIDEVARRFGLRPSALRYYEERGLIQAAARRGGKRYFDAGQLRRIAVIQVWKREGLLSLDSIASFLGEPADAPSWSRHIDAQIDALTDRIDQLDAARAYLRHVREHHDTTTPDGCPHFEAQLRAFGLRP